MEITTDSNRAWNLSSLYESPQSPQLELDFQTLIAWPSKWFASIEKLGPIFDTNFEAWENAILETEPIEVLVSHIGCYTYCANATDAKNEAYKKIESRLAQVHAEVYKPTIRINLELAKMSESTFNSFISRPRLKDIQASLKRSRVRGLFSMTEPLEALASDLSVNGSTAWSRLYDTVISNIRYEVDFPQSLGGRQTLNMGQRRTFIEDVNPEVRSEVFHKSNAELQKQEDVFASCLNAIIGARATLQKRRKIPHFLDIALRQSHMSREALDAMFVAIGQRRNFLQNFLKLKSKLLQKPLGFYDVSAPLPLSDTQRYSWDEGVALVRRAFKNYPALAEFSDQMIRERRIDSSISPNKRPGGFCTGSMKSNHSYVFLNYGGALGDVKTLAHELGHGFHSHIMTDLRPPAQEYPMTLAETASTFGEALLAQELLSDPNTSSATKAHILCENLDNAVSYLLDIPMRFTFEKKLYEERAAVDLSARRIRELVLEAQKEWFGDALVESEMDPMFWASKMHFYFSGTYFYNFPYSVGYLLSRALSARARAEGPTFQPIYEKLLRNTGSWTVDEFVQHGFGQDAKNPEFWSSTMADLDRDLEAYKTVVVPLIQRSTAH